MENKARNVTISISEDLIISIENLANSYREYNNKVIFKEYKNKSQCYEDLLKRGYDDKMREDNKRLEKWKEKKD